jgi:hypothetical protein
MSGVLNQIKHNYLASKELDDFWVKITGQIEQI